MRATVAVLLLALSLVSQGALAQTLERIKDTGVLKVGYRQDAAPYSYADDTGVPAGYTVDLCRAVAADVKRQLSLQDLDIKYVSVGAEDRFEAVKSGKIDLLCGATTATLSRREIVDFSLPTFIDGASVMTLKDGPGTFEGLAGHKIGVRAGTTTEEALKNTLSDMSIKAEVVPVSSHADGRKLLETKDVSAYFADQAILLFLAARSAEAINLRVAKKFFTYEPYALALVHSDDNFRLAVDRALSHIYKSGMIKKVFAKNFGVAQPSDALKALYLISALPE